MAALAWAGPVGDINEDNTVDIVDLELLAQQWLDVECSAPGCKPDIDGAGGVDLADFTLLSQHWLTQKVTLVINEFMAKNDGYYLDPCGQADDWFELFNYGNFPIDIGGMYVTDDPCNPLGWYQIPVGFADVTTIQPNGFLLLWADKDLAQGALHVDFALSAGGEMLGIIAADGQMIDWLSFGPQEADESYGRFPDGSNDWQMFSRDTSPPPTPGASNQGEPIKVIINEIMYHPWHDDENNQPENIGEEYIELYNNGVETIDLSNWQFTNGVEFTIPAGQSIGVGEYFIIAADPCAFNSKYGKDPNTSGWTGKLSNSGETIELTDAKGYQIDKVRYADQGEWAVRYLGPEDYHQRGWQWSNEHDGEGKSLELINPAQQNDYGQNWVASDPCGGTPGIVNSTATNETAPLILDVEHSPIIPRATDTVTVTARMVDESTDEVSATLHYRIDNSSYEQNTYPHHDPCDYTILEMYDDGLHGDGTADDGVYGVTIGDPCAQQDGNIIEFYIQAHDDAERTRTYPAPSLIDGVPEQVTNLLYLVDDSFDPEAEWEPGSQPIYHLIMTESERLRLKDIGESINDPGGEDDSRSHAQMNGTFITRDGVDMKLRYPVSIRNRGEGSRNKQPNSYRVNLLNDNPWKGVVALNLNTQHTQAQLAGALLFQMSNMIMEETLAAQVRVNGVNLADPAPPSYGFYVHIEVTDSDYAENHFPYDANGNLYKAERVGDDALSDLSYPPEILGYEKRTNKAANDWSDLFTLTNILNNAPDEQYISQLEQVVNIDQWLGYFAINTLMSNEETCLANGLGDDYFLYRGCEDTRFVLIPHDLDSILGQGGTIGSTTSGIFRATALPAVERFLIHPQIVPRYYAALKNLIETTFSSEKIAPFLDEKLGGYINQGIIDEMKSFVADRNAYVLSIIPQEFTIESDLPINSGYYYSTMSSATLDNVHGSANTIETFSVRVNDQTADWQPIYGDVNNGECKWSIASDPDGSITHVLVVEDAAKQVLVPSGPVSEDWKGSNEPFDDSTWNSGEFITGKTGGVGYDEYPDFKPYISYDVESLMNGDMDPCANTTCYIRIPFTAEPCDLADFTSLTLKVRYDDAFVAYINGQEAARSEYAPETLTWDSQATDDGPDNTAFQLFNISSQINLLNPGDNILAIHGLNEFITSSDFLISAELSAGIAGEITEGIALNPGVNRITVHTFDNPDGLGNELEQGHIDIWYYDGDESNLAGTLAQNTTLDAASGPWHITGDITVPAGLTLTIEPGTTLFFDAGVGITVNGRMFAVGSEYQRIRLTRVPGGGNWKGLSFNNTAEENQLSYVDMEYGDSQGESIAISYSTVVVDNMSWAGTNQIVLDMTHPKVIVSNSYIPGVDAEPVHGQYMEGDEYLILEGNVFGKGTGTGDIVDWDSTEGDRIYFIAINNIFLGGGDDGIDLDGTDAYLEGNVFMDFHCADPDTTSNAVSGGRAYSGVPNRPDITLVRNIFQDVDHALLIKEEACATIINNVFVDSTYAAIQFWEPEGRSPGGPSKGAYMEGNIFRNYDHLFNHQFTDDEYDPCGIYPDPCIIVNSSIIPAEFHNLGLDNIDMAPLFVDDESDFHLQPGSPAIGTGPAGLDMGRYVPEWTAITGEPRSVTWRTEATLTVGGPGIRHYKYRLIDDPCSPGSWSEAIRLPNNRYDGYDPCYVNSFIELSGLQDGHTYRVEVVGRNAAGMWQDENNATVSHTWTIDTGFSQLLLNEILAHSHGTAPDLIELYYDGPGTVDIGGMSITDNPEIPRKYVFAAGTTISEDPCNYLMLYADPCATLPGIVLGFSLSSFGEGVYLYDTPANGGGLVDSVEFGYQLNGYSIGRIGRDGEWKLTQPTLGGDNVIQPLNDPAVLKINEWFSNGKVLFEDDFIELYNPQALPVDLSGLYLTDHPVAQLSKYRISPLNFIDPCGFAVFLADDSISQGHVGFRLSANGEMIGLYDAELGEIDKVLYGPQTTDVSQGCMPDGSSTFGFFELPTPWVTNPSGPTTTETPVTLLEEGADKHVLVPTGPVSEDWKGGQPFDDNGWNDGTFIAGKTGGVGYDETPDFGPYITYNVDALMNGDSNPSANTTCYIRIAFTIDPCDLDNLTDMTLEIRYDDAFVAYINGQEVTRSEYVPETLMWDSFATGYNPETVEFHTFDISSQINFLNAGDNILAIHGLNTLVTSTDFLISAQLNGIVTTTQGDYSLAKELALLRNLRITEIMYHPPDAPAGDPEAEFIELQNVGDTVLDLTGVRFGEGIEFVFPTRSLEPGEYVLVIKNPAAFEGQYGSLPEVAGVYNGSLSNGGEEILLQLPEPYGAAILRFSYSDVWYPTTDGGGYSLVIRNPLSEPTDWDEAEKWQAAVPSPGAEN